MTSVADRHRFDADPDPTFHFDDDPGLDSNPIPSFKHAGKSGKSFGLLFTAAKFTLFIFFFSFVGL
jgi:hypothetical protein